MASLDDINDVVAAFLVAATDALALTDLGPPERIYTSAGRPALDCCGQLTAWGSFLGDAETAVPPGGMGGSMRKKLGSVPVLTIFVQATRCAQAKERQVGGKILPPLPASLAADSRATGQDIWALWNHLKYEIEHGTLGEVCKGAWRDGATAIEPQGGCVGWEIVYRYPMPGGYPFEIVT